MLAPLLLLAFLATEVPQPTSVDACVASIPVVLRSKLQTRFPDIRLPLVTDSQREDRDYAARRGDPCLLVSKTDLDGDGRSDFVLVLPRKVGKGYRLVVALDKSLGFKFFDLGSWSYPIQGVFVDTAAPGIYKHTTAYPHRPDSGTAEQITSARAGFYFGEVEGATDVYFFDRGQWRHVHAID